MATDDTATTRQGVAIIIDVLDNDSDPDGDAGAVAAPVSLKLERLGDTFTGYYSVMEPGLAEWVPLGSNTIPMNNEVHIGLAVTSGNEQAVCVATFDQISRELGGEHELPADVNGDGIVDFMDYAFLADQWLEGR